MFYVDICLLKRIMVINIENYACPVLATDMSPFLVSRQSRVVLGIAFYFAPSKFLAACRRRRNKISSFPLE